MLSYLLHQWKLFVSNGDFVGEVAHPENADRQPADKSEEANCAVVLNARGGLGFRALQWLEWVEEYQRQPGNRQKDGQAQFGGFGAGTIEDMIQDDDEQTQQNNGELEAGNDSCSPINHERRSNIQEAQYPQDGQDGAPNDLAQSPIHDKRLLSRSTDDTDTRDEGATGSVVCIVVLTRKEINCFIA